MKHLELATLIALVIGGAGAQPVTASSHARDHTAHAPRAAASGTPVREIFGFALASSLADPTVGYPSWDFSLLGTVAFFGLHVQDGGTFANDNGWSVWNSTQLSGMLGTAHSHGTKVVLTIVKQDFAPNTPGMCASLANFSRSIREVVRFRRELVLAPDRVNWKCAPRSIALGTRKSRFLPSTVRAQADICRAQSCPRTPM